MAGGGELVVQAFDHDGGREVSVYVPAATPEAVVFAGDGQLVAPWGADLERADLPATMVVGVHRLDDELARLCEYSPGFDPPRFAAHESFVVGEVRSWVRSRFGVDLPPRRTAVLGFSAGGELALALGLRHPDVFGTVLCGSPGAGFRPPDPLPSPLPRAYILAGMDEPFFQENADRWFEALGDAGAEVVMVERDGGHGDPFWREELPLMAAWAFG